MQGECLPRIHALREPRLLASSVSVDTENTERGTPSHLEGCSVHPSNSPSFGGPALSAFSAFLAGYS